MSLHMLLTFFPTSINGIDFFINYHGPGLNSSIGLFICNLLSCFQWILPQPQASNSVTRDKLCISVHADQIAFY